MLAAVGREVLAEGVELSLEVGLAMATGLPVRSFEPYSAENRSIIVPSSFKIITVDTIAFSVVF